MFTVNSDFSLEETRNAFKGFLRILERTDKQYEYIKNCINLCDKETEDLLHDIEFSKFYRTEGHRKARRLKEVRQERRNAKDLAEYLMLIRTFASKNSKMKSEIHKLLQALSEIEREQKKRVYAPRVIKDLDTANRHFECLVERTKEG